MICGSVFTDTEHQIFSDPSLYKAIKSSQQQHTNIQNSFSKFSSSFPLKYIRSEVPSHSKKLISSRCIQSYLHKEHWSKCIEESWSTVQSLEEKYLHFLQTLQRSDDQDEEPAHQEVVLQERKQKFKHEQTERLPSVMEDRAKVPSLSLSSAPHEDGPENSEPCPADGVETASSSCQCRARLRKLNTDSLEKNFRHSGGLISSSLLLRRHVVGL